MTKSQTYQTKDIHINMKQRRELISKVKAIETLTKEDMIFLKRAKQEKIESLREAAKERFDSKKNWSIMINPRDNDTRNKIMQKVKFEQEKRRCLHDFMRTTRDKLLKEGKERREKEMAE